MNKGFQSIRKEMINKFVTSGKEAAYIYLDFATLNNPYLHEWQIEELYRILDEMN